MFENQPCVLHSSRHTHEQADPNLSGLSNNGCFFSWCNFPKHKYYFSQVGLPTPVNQKIWDL